MGQPYMRMCMIIVSDLMQTTVIYRNVLFCYTTSLDRKKWLVAAEKNVVKI